jgi:hypothetical protein
MEALSRAIEAHLRAKDTRPNVKEAQSAAVKQNSLLGVLLQEAVHFEHKYLFFCLFC